MDLSLDVLKEMVFDYNSDFLLDMFEQFKEDCFQENLLTMGGKVSSGFIQIILDNIHLYDIHEDDDDFNSD